MKKIRFSSRKPPLSSQTATVKNYHEKLQKIEIMKVLYLF